MSRRSRNTPIDSDVQSLLDVFEDYEKAHPLADIEVYRQNWSSLRIRVIDPDFKGMDMVERDDAIWKILELAPENVQSQITFLVLLRPQETKKSGANLEFEDPVSLQL